MDAAERVSVRTFVFTLESATETQVARIRCDDSRWETRRSGAIADGD